MYYWICLYAHCLVVNLQLTSGVKETIMLSLGKERQVQF